MVGATLIPPGASAADWGLSAPPVAYAVQGSEIRIHGVRFTGDPAGGPSTGEPQLQVSLFAGSGTVHLDCSSNGAVRPINRVWLGPGNISAVGTPEEFAESFRLGIIYIAPESAPPPDVLTISAASSAGGTAFASISILTKPTHLTAWQAMHFTELELSEPILEATLWGPGAMPAGDGVANLVKFAFNRGPYETIRDLLPKPRLTNDGHTLVLDLIRRTDVPGLLYQPQWSSNLLNWDAHTSRVVVAESTPLTADLDKAVVRAVPDLREAERGFVKVDVAQGPPPVVPPPPPPPPITTGMLAEIRAQLSAMQLVPGDPCRATVAERAAARAQLRQNHGTVYGQLTQTMDLPPDCTSIYDIRTISNEGNILAGIDDVRYPGELTTRAKRGIDGQPVILTYEWIVENGRNKLRFRSPYNDRFLFRILYYDSTGRQQEQTLRCPGSVDEQGRAVAEDDCTRPYAGWPLILICGIAVSRFTAGGTESAEFFDLFGDLICGMGGNPGYGTVGWTTQERHGGEKFVFAMYRVQDMDICRSEIMARLQVIASRLGATLVRDGNIIRLTGPDAGGRCPNRFYGPWAD